MTMLRIYIVPFEKEKEMNELEQAWQDYLDAMKGCCQLLELSKFNNELMEADCANAEGYIRQYLALMDKVKDSGEELKESMRFYLGNT